MHRNKRGLVFCKTRDTVFFYGYGEQLYGRAWVTVLVAGSGRHPIFMCSQGQGKPGGDACTASVAGASTDCLDPETQLIREPAGIDSRDQNSLKARLSFLSITMLVRLTSSSPLIIVTRVHSQLHSSSVEKPCILPLYVLALHHLFI